VQTGVIAAPSYDMGRAVVDQRLDDPLGVVWQVPLTGFSALKTRLDTVSGTAVLTSSEHGVVALGAGPPDLRPGAGRWPVPVRVVGSSYPGQLMAADEAGTVYRLRPGQAPVPAWRSGMHPDDFTVLGLPGGRLLWDNFDGTGGHTELVDEATGQVIWRSRVVLSPVMPVAGQLIGGRVAAARGDLVSLDAGTGEERWRQRRGLGGLAIIAVVGDVVWAGDSIHSRLAGFSTGSGRPVATVALPRESRLTGVLDQAGNLHIGDEHGWLIIDLPRARVAADTRFKRASIGAVYAKDTVRSADGRLVITDDRGQVFVARPERPRRPDLVATYPEASIGIAAGKLILLSRDGVLTALGAPSSRGLPFRTHR
jgi:outer membrane protein assembly factor BamB